MKVQEIPRAWRAAVLVAAWAAVYLVNVGVSELSFNEGRRVFPAQGMRVTGEWLQPMLAGELYDRKPPLFNWMIAASFRCFGESEMSARLPGAVALLVLVLVLGVGRGEWLGARERLLGALALLGSLAFWNQTREASIDGAYGCACGLAVLSWTGSFLSGRRSWALWLMPGLWMGLAMLLKGPAALLLVVLLSVCVLRAAGEGRAELKRPGLWAGVALTLGIFFTWVALKQGQAAPGEVSAGVPTAGESMWAVWKTELGQRLFTNPEGGKVFRLGKYLERVLSGLATLLPWLALVIWAGRPSTGAAPTGAGAAFWRGGRQAAFAFCVLICAMPLTKARYLLPVLPLLVLLSVWRLGALAEPQWLPVLRRWLRRGLVALLPLLPLAGLVLAGASVVQVPALPLTPAWGWSSLLLLTALGLLGWRVQRATVDAPGWWRVVGDTALLSCLVLSLAGAVGSPVEQARDGESARAVAEWDRHLPAEVELLCCDVNLAQPCLFSLGRHRPLRYLTALPEQAGYRYGDQYSVRAEHVSAAQAAELCRRHEWLLVASGSALEAALQDAGWSPLAEMPLRLHQRARLWRRAPVG